MLDFKDNPEFKYQLGLALLDLEDYSGSISSFEDCVHMNYKTGDSQLFIGLAYQYHNDYPSAMESFIKAIELEPDHFHAMDSLARLKLKRGLFDEAWTWADKSSKLAPMYYSPRAILIALTIALKKRRSIEKLVKGVPDWNRFIFRTEIEEYLKLLDAEDYREQLDMAFVSIYGSNCVKSARVAKRSKKNLP